MSKKNLSILILIFCTAIWGTTFPVIKEISDKIDATLLSTVRSWIATIFFGIFILITKKTTFLKDKTTLISGFLLGAINAGIYISQTIGLQTTSSTHSAFITSSSVIMVPIILFFAGKNKLDFKQIITILCVSVGLFLLTNSGSENSDYKLGDTITLFGAIICALSIIVSGIYAKKVNVYGLVFYQFFFSAILSLIVFFVFKSNTNAPILFSFETIPNVLYLSLMATLISFFGMLWAQQYLNTVMTAMVLSLEPIFATLAGYIYVGEIVTTLEIIGGMFVLVGIIYYNLSKSKD